MRQRPLPWYVQPPYEGCDGKVGYHTVWDADGDIVCECYSDEDKGRQEAITICDAVNRAGPKVCANCGAPATCFGSYEDELSPAYACDDCCAHGCEDGHCEQIAEAT